MGDRRRHGWRASVAALALAVVLQPLLQAEAATTPVAVSVAPVSDATQAPPPAPNPPVQEQAPPTRVGADGRPLLDAMDKRFDPARSREVPTPDLNLKRYANPDGTTSLRIGLGPIKGYDENGVLGDLDLSLATGKDGRLRPRRAVALMSFASTSGRRLASLEVAPGKSVDLVPDGLAAGVKATRRIDPQGEAALFDKVLPNDVSVEVQPLSQGLKTSYVLPSVAGATGLVERLTLPAGFSARQASGLVEILDGSGAVVASWSGGSAVDSSRPPLDNEVRLELQSVRGGEATAKVVVDPQWFADPQRAYPVTIDPQVLRKTSYGATFVENGRAAPQWNASEGLRIGTYNGGANVNRSLIRFPLDGLPANSRVLGGTMWVYETWSWSCQARSMSAHRISGVWDSSVTWPSQPSFWGSAESSSNVAAGYEPGGCGDAWQALDLSALIRDWYSGAFPQNGVLLKASNESDNFSWKRFSGAPTGTPPLLDVVYESYGSSPIGVNDGDTQPPATVGAGFQGMWLTNQGTDTWPANGAYRASYHLYNSSWQLIRWDGVRTLMPQDVPPGATVYVHANIEALPVGDYILAWDMVQEGVTWFSSQGVPTVNRSYHSNQPPTPATLLSPANGATLASLTPTLTASSTDPDSATLQYLFRVCTGSDGESGQCADSGWIDASSWTVPAGRLSWSTTYYWHTWVRDNSPGPYGVVNQPATRLFTTSLPLVQPEWSFGNDPYASYYGGVNTAIGNYVTTATDFSIAGPGPSLQLARTYNSMDTGTAGRWFGPGWTSTYETSLSFDGSGNGTVTYPDGRREFLSANGDGTYAPAFGFASGMTRVTVSGTTYYDLKHRDQSVWRFRTDGLVDSIRDSFGRKLQLTWTLSGGACCASVVVADATTSRSLTATFSGPLSQGGHVTSVASSQVTVGGTTQQLRWTYTYTGGRLASACDPTDTPSLRVCTAYENAGPGGRLTKITRPNANAQVTLTYDTANRVATRQDGLGNSMIFDYGTAYRSTVLADSPRAYYRLGEASGATAANQVASSPAGTYTGGVTLGQRGGLTVDTDTAARLDGTSGHVAIPAASTLNVAGPLTIEAWVNRSSQANAPIVEYNSGSAMGVHVWTYPNPDTLWANFMDTAGASHWIQAPGALASVGTWYHVAAVYDGTNAFLYVNGVQVATSNVGSFTPQTSYPLYIGRRPQGTPNGYFAGLTDEVAVYAGALPAARIAAHFAAGTQKTTTVTDSRNFVTRSTYNGLNQLLKHVNEESATRSFTYDQRGFLNAVTDENGNTTVYTNDAAGNVLQVRNGAGNTTYKEYDAQNRLTAVRDPRSSGPTDNTYVTRTTYDTAGNRATEQSPAGTRRWTFSAGTEAAVGGGTVPANLLLTATDAMGHVTRYEYDAAGNLRRKTSPTALLVEYTYDELGRELSRKETSDTFPTGLVTALSYDLAGRLSVITEPGIRNVVTGVTHQRRTTMGYDRNGNLVSVAVADATGGDTTRTTTFGYDADDRQTTLTDPYNKQRVRTYDTVGNVTQEKDELNRVVQTTYTPRNLPSVVKLLAFVDDPINPGAPRDVTLASYTYDAGGRQVTATDALGRVRRSDYDQADRLTKLTQPGFHNRDASTRDVVLESRGYDAADHLTVVIYGNGTRETDGTYDAAGRLASTATYGTADGPAGARTTAYTYDANGNLVTRTLSNEADGVADQVNYHYDLDQAARLDQVEVVNQGSWTAPWNVNQLTTYTYDRRDLRTSMVSPRGNFEGPASDFTTTYTNDEAGRLVTTVGPPVAAESGGGDPATVRPVVSTGYDTFDEPAQVKDARSNVTTFTYDLLGRRTGIAYPTYVPPTGPSVSASESWQYDAVGNVVRWTDRRGRATTYDYDMRSRLVRQTDPTVSGQPAAGTLRLTYDDVSNRTSLVDQVGARQEWTYDDFDRTRTHTLVERVPGPSASRFTWTYDYDDRGDPTYEATPLNEVTARTFDAFGDLSTQTDPLGKSIQQWHDRDGRVVYAYDELGRSRQVFYDQAGNEMLDQRFDTWGNRTEWFSTFYDIAWNVIATSVGDGAQTTMSYDALNRVSQVTEPVTGSASITTSVGYDASGNRTRLTDGNGNATVATYNAWNLPETQVEPSTTAHPSAPDRTWTRTYDAGGLLLNEALPGGRSIAHTYDELGRPQTDVGTVGGASTTSGYGWDLAGNQVSSTGTGGSLSFGYNDRRQVVAGTGAAGTSSFSYDADGRLLSRTDAAGTATFGWNARGDLRSVTEPVTGVQETLTYDDAGELAHIDYGTGGATRDYGYDGRGLLASDVVKKPSGAVVYQASYQYDVNRNLVQKQLGAGQPGSGTHLYTYDLANRLTSWTAPGGQVTGYAWDGAGNRVQAGAQTYTYDQRNRMLSGAGATYVWAADGSLTSETTPTLVTTYGYDGLGRLVQAQQVARPPASGTTTTTYTYDGLDRVVKRNLTAFAYAGLDGEPVSDGTSKFGRGPGGGLLATSTGGQASLAVLGGHGDVEMSVDAQGNVRGTAGFDPFGVGGPGGSQQRLGFQGDWTDPATGKVWMGARWYDPGSGRFLSRDDFTVPVASHVDANRYLYGSANPLGYVDPTGHCGISLWPPALVSCDPLAGLLGQGGGQGMGSDQGTITWHLKDQQQSGQTQKWPQAQLPQYQSGECGWTGEGCVLPDIPTTQGPVQGPGPVFSGSGGGAGGPRPARNPYPSWYSHPNTWGVAAPALSTMTDGKAPGMAIPNSLVALASASSAKAIDPTNCMGSCTGMQSGDSAQGIVPGAMGAAGAPFGGGAQCSRDFGGLTPPAWLDVCDEAQALGKSVGQWIVDNPEAALMLCGMVPVIGVPCNLVLAGIDISRGDYLGAGLAVGMALLPGAGAAREMAAELRAGRAIAAAGERGPIIADTVLLGEAADRGNPAALRLIRGGPTYIPPGVLSEFLNSTAADERFAFLQREGIRVLDGPMDSNVYRMISQSAHGPVDAELAALAKGTGYTAYTLNVRLVNFIKNTPRLADVPIERFKP